MTWTKWHSRMAIVLSVALLLMSYCAQAGAEAGALDRRGSLKVVLTDGDDLEPLKGEIIEIYRVADILELYPAAYALTDAFAGCAVTVNGSMTTAEREDAAVHLANFADTHGIAPLATKKSDKSGAVLFSDLSAGLYLVALDDRDGKCAYTMQPFVISLPMSSEDGTGWNDEIDAEPKLTAKVEPTPTPTPSEKLPQTGMDYAPIYWLLAGGALLIAFGIAGLAIGKRGKNK